MINELNLQTNLIMKSIKKQEENKSTEIEKKPIIKNGKKKIAIALGALGVAGIAAIAIANKVKNGQLSLPKPQRNQIKPHRGYNPINKQPIVFEAEYLNGVWQVKR